MARVATFHHDDDLASGCSTCGQMSPRIWLLLPPIIPTKPRQSVRCTRHGILQRVRAGDCSRPLAGTLPAMIALPQSLFVVVAGPSGSGKSTLIHRFLRDHPHFIRCLSTTTRAPRGSERDGIDYLFVTPEEFARRTDAGAFLEHATVFGKHSYGTSRSFVDSNLAAGRSVIKDVDVQGAAQIRATMPAAVQLFVVPPSQAELEKRLRGRGTESEEQVTSRLEEAARELARWREFDFVIINDDLERAAADLAAIVRAATTRVPRTV